MAKFIILFLLLVQAAWAAPLDEGYRFLSAGDLEKSGRIFASIKGADGQIARARRLVAMGRSDRALAELQGSTIPLRITRLEVLVDAGYYTDARELLTKLESEGQGDIPGPYRFRFYLARGELEMVARRLDLANKNFSLAKRLAVETKEKLQVADRQLRLYLAQEKLIEAEIELEKASMFLDGLRDIWALAHHLKISAKVHESAGRLGTAAVLNTAEREIHLSHQNPVMAARALFANQSLLQLSNSKEGAAQNCLDSLEEFLQAKDYASVAGSLQVYTNLRFGDGKARLITLYEKTLERMPVGIHRDHVRLAYIPVLRNTDSDSEAILELARALLEESDDREIRTHAHRSLGIELRNDGQFELAMKSYRSALELSRPQLRADRNWANSPGPITLSMAILKLRRHR